MAFVFQYHFLFRPLLCGGGGVSNKHCLLAFFFILAVLQEKLVLGVSDRSDTNRAVQPQKMTRYIGKRDCIIYVAKSKAQISCTFYWAADLGLFLHMQKAGFLMSQLISLVTRNKMYKVKPQTQHCQSPKLFW